MGIRVEVVRVFTDPSGRFGNRLGIARAADVAEPERQELARRAGYSETVVVAEPVDGIAPLRIYTPAVELPFAGHPSVGTAWWFLRRGIPVTALRVPAGLVAVASADGRTWITAKADWTPDFVFHRYPTAAEVTALDPADFPGGPHYVWAWSDEHRGSIRSRMFGPTMGITEDEATGAAAVAITAQLRRGLHITQGAGSHLFTRWDSDGWVRLGGRVADDSVAEF
ncbi:PhzF family phenazine biosynthesis protein [Nocardia sp. NPDC057227]|uniref:PhzF family phenazine biosynthesis protein n=1 Tax=Nocardia sp. NPDC057227 TaxID=3346056 RepID=UPI00362BF8BB